MSQRPCLHQNGTFPCFLGVVVVRYLMAGTRLVRVRAGRALREADTMCALQQWAKAGDGSAGVRQPAE